MNESDDDRIHECLIEGFVIVDKDFHRIKVKSVIYSILHYLINNGDFEKLKLIKLIIKNKLDVADICIAHPKYAPIISHCFNEYITLRYQTEEALKICRILFQKYGVSIKEISSYISVFPFSAFVFKGLTNNKTFDELLKDFRCPEKVIYRRIKAYENKNNDYFHMLNDLKQLLFNLRKEDEK